MNDLIKITTDGEGKKLVSARELYLGLGLNKSNWSRWYPTNIEKNEFFRENIDWVGVRHNDEGIETMDFAITLDFAKHIAMMARSSKSHEYRNYFIECEEKAIKQKQLSPLDQLRLQYQVIETHEEKLEEHDKKINLIEDKLESLEVNPSQRRTIQNFKHKRVVELLGGRKTKAYMDRSFRSRVYSDMGREYLKYFDIPSYELTPKNKFSEALEVIESYNLSTELSMDLRKINNQIAF